jgi:hypothetical protein
MMGENNAAGWTQHTTLRPMLDIFFRGSAQGKSDSRYQYEKKYWRIT